MQIIDITPTTDRKFKIELSELELRTLRDILMDHVRHYITNVSPTSCSMEKQICLILSN